MFDLDLTCTIDELSSSCVAWRLCRVVELVDEYMWVKGSCTPALT